MADRVQDSLEEEIEEKIDVENHFHPSIPAYSVEDQCARLVI